MKAWVVSIEDGGRIILGKIRPVGERSVSLEIHRGDTKDKDAFKMMFALLTPDELGEIRDGIDEMIGPKK